jgi:hypothetical protein
VNGKTTEVKHAITGTWQEFKLKSNERIAGMYGKYFSGHTSELLKSLGFIIEIKS